jgi:hypothetical protein
MLQLNKWSAWKDHMEPTTSKFNTYCSEIPRNINSAWQHRVDCTKDNRYKWTNILRASYVWHLNSNSRGIRNFSSSRLHSYFGSIRNSGFRTSWCVWSVRSRRSYFAPVRYAPTLGTGYQATGGFPIAKESIASTSSRASRIWGRDGRDEAARVIRSTTIGTAVLVINTEKLVVSCHCGPRVLCVLPCAWQSVLFHKWITVGNFDFLFYSNHKLCHVSRRFCITTLSSSL